jgi:hypothetical protein
MLKRDHGNEWHQEQRRGVAQPGSALAWGSGQGDCESTVQFDDLLALPALDRISL